jgi:hypothetical protein
MLQRRRKKVTFHDSSKIIYDWLNKQPSVKEESLTDWLLYYTAEHCSNLYYQEFTRHKEACNGADWEWWILTPGYGKEYNAYRFFVQAKKLLTNGRDNYQLLSYGNKNGYQIDLLIETAKQKNAFPLYLYYSTAPVDTEKQIDEFRFIDRSVIYWCDDCKNGCYLSPAIRVYKELYEYPRRKLRDTDVVNKALKLSLLDLLFRNNVEHVLDQFNNKHILPNREKVLNNFDRGVYGIKHYGVGIPDYLKIFVNRRGEKLEWLQAEMRIDDIDGIAVLDFRNIDEVKRVYDESRF